MGGYAVDCRRFPIADYVYECGLVAVGAGVSVVDGEPEIEVEAEFASHGEEVICWQIFFRVTGAWVRASEALPKSHQCWAAA